MLYNDSFETLIKKLPEIIMKSESFIEQSKIFKKNRKEYFKEICKWLSLEFNFEEKLNVVGINKYEVLVEDEQFKKYIKKKKEIPVIETNVEKKYETVYRLVYSKEFRNCFGADISEFEDPEDTTKYLKYNFEIFSLRRCVENLYYTFFWDVSKQIDFWNGTRDYILGTQVHNNVAKKILVKLNAEIIIDGALPDFMGVDLKICNSLANDIRWFLEQNINVTQDDNVIFVDIDKSNKPQDDVWKVSIQDAVFIDPETNLKLTMETTNDKNKIEKIVKKIDSGSFILSKYQNYVYQARILMNEKMQSILNGKWSAASLGVRMKYLGFLRQGLSEYEAFSIEKQSRIYLVFILTEGMLKSNLLVGEEIVNFLKADKVKKELLKNSMESIWKENNIKTVLAKQRMINCNVKEETLLLLQLFYIISSVHSTDLSLVVAQTIMEELQSIKYEASRSIKEILLEVNDILIQWVKKFNFRYDFLFNWLLYLSASGGVKDRLNILRKTKVYSLNNCFRNIDGRLRDMYMGQYYSKNEYYENLLNGMRSSDSEKAESRIWKIVNQYIKHRSNPEIFN